MAKKFSLDRDGPITIVRDAHGVPRVTAGSLDDLYYGLGYCHAMDRGLQMLLMRILGQGRASELLEASDELLEVDVFFRRMNWRGHLDEQIDALPEDVRRRSQAYCDGVNARLAKRRPFEMRLVGYRKAAPWTLGHSIMMSRLVGYLTLAQSQWELERLLVEMVQAGTDPAALEELFPGQLGGLDVDLIKQVKLGDRIVPESLRWGSPIPRMMASNNWVVSGTRTASGKPILANDPHLETNRLPNVWYEVVLRAGDRYAITATMPGLPAMLVGRTHHLAWGATYTFMDAIDSWVEHCKEGSYLRGTDWVPFETRREVIKRKKKPDHEVVFYENDHGVLDGDPNVEGHYLASRWASSRSGARSLAGAQRMWEAATVEHGMRCLGELETAWNWVLADRLGNIGYQMSGMLPRRREGVSGLVPLPGWDPQNDWQGFVDHTELPRVQNPEAGYFVTANQDLNEFGAAPAINAPMGAYRAERIAELLEADDQLTVEANHKIHYDVHSRQADAFMAVLRPLLPDTPAGRLLADWNHGYDPGSKGAWLFERAYRALLTEVFGERGLGREIADHLWGETGIFCDFYLNFDRVLLGEESRWFGGEARDDLYRRVLAEALGDDVEPKPWRTDQQLTLTNIFFAGKLPRFLGFDRGPVTIRGGRATPHQGQIYRSAGRATSFTPSFRFITDLATEELHSNMAGGPRDRRFSRFYCSDLKNWLAGEYKLLRGD